MIDVNDVLPIVNSGYKILINIKGNKGRKKVFIPQY